MPKMLVLSSDHGAEFSSLFTQVCTFNDIVQKGSTPSRSQSMGTVELANKLLHQNLSRICSSSAAGSLHWSKLLPRLVRHITSFYPYKSKLSRVQILFSPFINCQEQQDDSDMSVVEEATDEVQEATEGVRETTDKFDDDDEDFQEDKNNTESENNHRYNLRSRKILKVQMADMHKVEVPCNKSWKNKNTSKPLSSILKPTKYGFNFNVLASTLRAETKDNFYSRKRALL